MLHHPGCDLQRCPCCRQQLISCGCAFDEPGFGGDWDEDADDDLDDESYAIDDAALAAAMRAIEARFRR
jgi:hypothetical protein